jgi:hypothetical protein
MEPEEDSDSDGDYVIDVFYYRKKEPRSDLVGHANVGVA